MYIYIYYICLNHPITQALHVSTECLLAKTLCIIPKPSSLRFASTWNHGTMARRRCCEPWNLLMLWKRRFHHTVTSSQKTEK